MTLRRVLRCLPLLVLAACTSTPTTSTKGVTERKVSSRLPATVATKASQAPNAGVLGSQDPNAKPTPNTSPTPTAAPSPSPTPTAGPSPSPTAGADTTATGSASTSPRPSASPTAGPGSAPSPTPVPGSSPGSFNYIRALSPTFHLETDSTSQMAVVAGTNTTALLIPNGADINVVVANQATVSPYNFATALGGAIANLQAVTTTGTTAYTVATVGGAFQLITITIDPGTFAATASAKPITGLTPKRIGGLVLKDASTLIAADTQNSTLYTINLADGSATLYAGAALTVGTAVGAATDTRFSKPTSLVLDGTTLYVLDSINNRILKDDLTSNTFSVLVGSAGNGTADGAFTAAQFTTPQSMFLDNKVLYVADTGNSNLRAVDLTAKTVSTFTIQSGGTVLNFGRGVGVLNGQVYGAANTGDLFSFRPSL